MIEKIVYDYLVTALSPTKVALEKPETLPAKMVVIEKTGSSEYNRIQTATLAIQSYDTSLFKAASLNELVKEKMAAITNTTDLYRCECLSDYNYTDTTKKGYRYQAVFEISY